jgi:Uma2 family endonuclease
MAMPSDSSILFSLQAADEAGVKLEMVGGLPIWEAMPTPQHQRAIDRIRKGITVAEGQTGCACLHLSDVAVRFSDDSFKRPDISIFGQEPDELSQAVTLLPEAVIEVVSRGYEAKDYEISLPFYLKVGVKDVIIFDPSRNHVLHARQDGNREHTSPVTIRLECGCVCTV